MDNATSLTSLNAPDLEEVSDKFSISSAVALSTLSLPKLEKAGEINWIALPELDTVQLNTGVTDCPQIIISNTAIKSLDGFHIDRCSVFNINNNPYLESVDAKLESVSNTLEISYNSEDVEVKFDTLKWANNITLRDVSSASFSNLTNVNSSMGFVNNTFNGLAAPQVKNIGGSLAIVSNGKLSNVSFPKLEQIGGGFQIANNTNLKSILGFPKLKSVGGAIDFEGSFSSASLSNLDLVKGGVDVESDSSKFNCSSWDELHSNGDIHGDNYVCKGASTSVSVRLTGSQTTGGGGSAGETGSGSSSSGGAYAISVEYTPLFGAVAAFIFQYL